MGNVIPMEQAGKYPQQAFCGCCGRPYRERDDPFFCSECQPHLDRKRGGHEYQTYYAQFKKDCPFSDAAP